MTAYKIAFGPMIGLPSTGWVGEDVAKFLSDEHNISYFKNFDEYCDADTIIILKIMPPLDWIIKCKQKNKKLIYIPIDYFYNAKLLERDGIKLTCFDSIMVHNLRLGRFIETYNKNVFEIDHYLKYKITAPSTFKNKGYILWVGHLEYLPPLFDTLKDITLTSPLKLLVDLENIEEKESFLRESILNICKEFTLTKINDEKYLLNDLMIEQWTKEKQHDYLVGCKAAFDTKGNTFAHNLKPPTKAQKYVYNRIPFAIDPHSYAYEYFLNKGLSLPSLKDEERWLSEEYFNELNTFVDADGASQALEYVAKSYLAIIDKTPLIPLKKSQLILKIIFSINCFSYLFKRFVSEYLWKK